MALILIMVCPSSDLIRSKVNNSSCLGIAKTGGDIICNPPDVVTISNITNYSALVSWNNALNGTSYILEYKLSSSNTWIVFPAQMKPVNY
jgi:hypothetical protein